MDTRKLRILSSAVHIIIAGFQLSYIYTPLHDVPGMLRVVQWGSTPLLFLSGLLMVVGRRQARRAYLAQQAVVA
jgi:hypothetical protein